MVVFAVLLAVIAYIDRVAIGQAAPAIMRELNLSPLQMGFVFSAFGLTYAAFEIPSGWLIDRIGPRKVLTRVVLWWSFFTMATGWAWNFPSLLAIRLLFGAGESGCYPGLAKVFARWLPPRERGMAEGLKAAGSRWGAAVTPLLVVALYRQMSWRQTFLVFGLAGVVWAVAFAWWFRDDPHRHPGVNAEERRLLGPPPHHGHEPVRWRALLRSRSAWALCLQWFCHFYGFYFYITWLPTYLQQARGLDLSAVALLAGLPMFLSGIGSLVCGWMLGRAERWTSTTASARKRLAYVAYGGAATLLLLFTRIEDPVAAVVVLGLSSALAELSGPTSWTTAMDLGGRAVGTLSAAMNMMGHLGGAAAPTVIGLLLTASNHNWTLTFYASAAVYACGALCWMVLDPVTPLDGAPAVSGHTMSG